LEIEKSSDSFQTYFPATGGVYTEMLLRGKQKKQRKEKKSKTGVKPFKEGEA